jgi:hypothetical protein
MQREDFNLHDAYRIFHALDYEGLKDGLDAIGIYPTPTEVQNFLHRFDSNADGKMSFEDFSEVFTPMQDYYAHVLQVRPSNYRSPNQQFLRRDDCFDNATQIAFRHLIRQAFTHEQKA